MALVLRQKETVRHVQVQDGSVEEQREPVFVYVHCYNQVCPLYHNLQEALDFERKVPGIREETQYTYLDRGGDMPGIENTHVNWLPADPQDAICPECGDACNVSQNQSYKLQQFGVGPGMGLKGAERAAAVAAAKVNEANAAQDVEVAELKKQLAKQQGLLEKLVKAQLGKDA
jgi:hypothetical protein